MGYGRGTPTNSLWIGNLSSKTSESELSKVFNVFGQVQQCLIDRKESQALIRYITIEICTKAFAEMHGKNLDGKHIAVYIIILFPKKQITDTNYSRLLIVTIRLSN